MAKQVSSLSTVQRSGRLAVASPQSSCRKASPSKLPSYFWKILTPIGVVCWGITIGVWGYQALQPPIQIASDDVVKLPTTGSGGGGSNVGVARWKVARAFARTIFMAEGTWYEGTPLNPYRTEVFTYRQIGDFSDHPHQYGSGSVLPSAIINGKRVYSGAVGAAQWLPDTWNRLRALKRFWFPGKKFSPENQDMAMLYELERTGSLQLLFSNLQVKSGKPIVNRSSFEPAIYKASGVWASLPTNAGDDAGAHGQGARSIDKLWKSFQHELDREEKLWK